MVMSSPCFLKKPLFLSELDHLDDSGRTGRDEIDRRKLGASNRSTRKNDNKKDAAKNSAPTHLSFSIPRFLLFRRIWRRSLFEADHIFLQLRDQLPIVCLSRYIPASYQLHLHPRKRFRDGALTIQTAKHY